MDDLTLGFTRIFVISSLSFSPYFSKSGHSFAWEVKDFSKTSYCTSGSSNLKSKSSQFFSNALYYKTCLSSSFFSIIKVGTTYFINFYASIFKCPWNNLGSSDLNTSKSDCQKVLLLNASNRTIKLNPWFFFTNLKLSY